MSKNKSKFGNKAARRFNEISKVDTMSQQEIYEILEGDLKIMLDQMTDFRNHKPGSPHPQYIANAFANISTALFFNEFIDEHCRVTKKGKLKTDLDEDELESMKQIIADAYKKSATNFYDKQIQEYADRNELLSKAFKRLEPRIYRLTGKLKGLDKAQRRDLTIQIYGDPVFNMRQVHKIFNQSTVSDKKKLHLMKEMYGKKRFVRAVGAAMTVEGNNSDCLGMLFEYVNGLKKKKRAPFLMAYAEAYKRNKSRYFRIDEAFFMRNKKLIRELRDIDRGYRKAFELNGVAKGGKGKKDKDRVDHDRERPRFK